MASRLCGSSPALGSSRNRTAGRCAIARATSNRCASPPESSVGNAWARSVRRNCASSSVARDFDFEWPCRNNGNEKEIFEGCQRAVKRVVLRDNADLPASDGGFCNHIASRNENISRSRQRPCRADADRCGLARTVRPQQSEDSSGRYRKIDSIDRDNTLSTFVDLRQRFNGNDSCGREVGNGSTLPRGLP